MSFKWGIIGTGHIAGHFADSVKAAGDNETVAVYSRTEENGKRFKEEYGVSRAYFDLDAFLSDKEIECVYVATPHNSHYYYAKKALENGKPVLIEKPMCISEEEAKDLFETGKRKKLFVMEGMWSSFLPALKRVKEIVDSGEIGKVRKVYGDFAFYSDKPASHRLKNPELAGGALYDLGVYPLHFIVNILGLDYKTIDGTCLRGETPVDYASTVIINYGDAIGVADSGINAMGHNLGIISAEHGKIIFPKFERKNKFTVVTESGEREEIVEQEEFGFVYEIREAASCIRAKKITSETETPEKTLLVHRWTDELLKNWGFKK